MKKEIECCVCRKKIYRTLKHINESEKNGWRVFCSSRCQSEGKKTGKTVQCFCCGKKVWKCLVELKSSKSGNLFCSKRCATVINNSLYKKGENHPNYNNGRFSYRKLAFENHEVRCCVCGYDVLEVLQVHHVDGDRGNNEVKNLIIVCPTHHREIHLGLRKI